MLERSGDTPSIITALILLDISSYKVHELLGKLTVYGFQSCTDKQVTCGCVYKSFSNGVIVVTPSIVPLKDNSSIKSWSSIAMRIGDFAKGLS